MVKILDETGEVVETVENAESYELARAEFNRLPIVDTWIERKEQYEAAKEQFEMIDKPLRQAIKDLFEKFSITHLNTDYIDISEKRGYVRKSWNEEKLIAFIYKNGGDPADFKDEKWINGTIQMKYKE